MLFRFSIRLLAALAVLLSAVFLGSGGALADSAPPGEPGLGIKLTEVPENLAEDPRAQIYVIDNLPPGTTATRRFQIENRTGAHQSVRLYPGPAVISDDGSFDFGDAGTKNELSSWIKLDRPAAELDDGIMDYATATITVPKDATEGERYAVIWAEISSSNPSGVGAKMVNRVGIRLYLSVGPGNGPQANFRISSVTPQRNADGQAELIVEATNTGGRAIDLGGEASLSDGPGGLALKGQRSSHGATVAPGNSGKVTFTYGKDLPNGPWTATVELTSGLISKSQKATFTFPASGVGESLIFSDGDSSLIWYGVGAVLLVAAIAGGYVIWRRRQAQSTDELVAS